MELRYYQLDAIRAVYEHLRTRADNPCIVIPTAGGKTAVMATICRDSVIHWKARVLILAHVKELLQQTAHSMHVVCPDVSFGVYSAGLNRRDRLEPVIIAGIQSVYQKATEFSKFDAIIVDEAHLIPSDGEGRYRMMLEELKVVNPKLRVIGLTATPYRMKGGLICKPENILNHVCYEIGVKQLIDNGFICQLISKGGTSIPDTSGLHIRAGEFISDEVQRLVDCDEYVVSACKEIARYTRSRKSVLIFAAGVNHGVHVAKVLSDVTKSRVETVFGDTLPFQREEVISDFKLGKFKYLVNVNVLTTGFDAPNIDCVVMLRPTASPGLYYQQVGRGFRLHDQKENCLVLDYGGNIIRHGPVDTISIQEPGRAGGESPAKECPSCHTIVACGYATCPDCGYEFPSRNSIKHDGEASDASVLSAQATFTELDVSRVEYYEHIKRGSGDNTPRTMRVEYVIGDHGLSERIREWVCFEHTGYARIKAEKWWKGRSNVPIPKTTKNAVSFANRGALCKTLKIVVKDVTGKPFPEIVKAVLLGSKPGIGDLTEVESIGDEDEVVAAPVELHNYGDNLGIRPIELVSEDDVPF